MTLLAVVQVPVCSPSLGIAVPAGSFAAHRAVARLQYWPTSHSLSAPQPPTGAQTLLPVQKPDWHSELVAGVQPVLVSAMPHLPPSQTFTTHWFAALQVTPFRLAQVFVLVLQRPPWQAALPRAQVPPCRPSLGTATPGPSLLLQVRLERSQYWLALQSASM